LKKSGDQKPLLKNGAELKSFMSREIKNNKIMAKIVSKTEVLNNFYSKEIEKINEFINKCVKDNLGGGSSIVIPFNDIFDVPEKHYGSECINIAKLMREQGWDVEIIDGNSDDIENTIENDGWDSDEAGWAIS